MAGCKFGIITVWECPIKFGKAISGFCPLLDSAHVVAALESDQIDRNGMMTSGFVPQGLHGPCPGLGWQTARSVIYGQFMDDDRLLVGVS